MEAPPPKFKILFLCTWNASRSIFAEYFMKEIGSSRFEAFSAGVTPKGQVSPITLKVLQENRGSQPEVHLHFLTGPSFHAPDPLRFTTKRCTDW